jgi:structural maintenance of chromosomes protein 5
MLKALNSKKQQLKTLEDRNAMLERDVQRFNERKEFECQVGFLLLFLSWITLSL